MRGQDTVAIRGHQLNRAGGFGFAGLFIVANFASPQGIAIALQKDTAQRKNFAGVGVIADLISLEVHFFGCGVRVLCQYRGSERGRAEKTRRRETFDESRLN